MSFPPPAPTTLPPPSAAATTPPAHTPSSTATMRRAELLERNRRIARRRTRAAGAIAVGVAVVAGGAMWIVQRGGGDDGLPDVGRPAPDHRSITIAERLNTAAGSETNLVRVDVVDHAIAIDSQQLTASAVLRDGAWFAPDAAGGLQQIPTDPFLDRLEERVMARADGFSIDEALPPAVRAHVEIRSVVDDTVHGRATKRFDLVVRTNDLAQQDREAYDAFSSVWGDPEQTPPPDVRLPNDVSGMTLLRPTQLSLWVDDAGWVWRWESVSGLTGANMEGELVDPSSDPYVPSLPVTLGG